MGVGGRHSPAALLPGKTRYPMYRRLGGTQCRSGRLRENSLPTGIRSPDRPARNESLYWLSYSGPLHTMVHQLSVRNGRNSVLPAVGIHVKTKCICCWLKSEGRSAYTRCTKESLTLWKSWLAQRLSVCCCLSDYFIWCVESECEVFWQVFGGA